MCQRDEYLHFRLKDNRQWLIFFMTGTSKGTKKSVTLPYEDTKGQKKGNYYCILYLFIFCLTAMQGDGG